MPEISIHNAGAFGLAPDEPPHELPPEAWSAGQNIRFRDGYAEKFLGHSALYDPPSVAPYWLLPYRQPDVNYWIYAGLAAAYVTDGSVHKNITNSGGAYSATEPLGWTGGVLGGVPILNNGVDDPQQWDGDFSTPGLLTDLTNWPASTTAKVLRVFRQFLIALDVTKSGTRFPHMVKWSHPAEPGAVPASWDETDPTYLAGEFDLAETGGLIQEAAPLRDILVLYKEGSTYTMQHIGGTLVFRIAPLYSEIGAMSRRCVAPLRGRHAVFGFEDIALHDGQQIESLVQRRMKRFIRNNLDGDNYGLSFIAAHPREQELWFCFPQTGSDRPDLAAVWNMRSNTWGVRDLPLVADLKWGVVSVTDDDTWDTGTDETWDGGADITWGERLFNPANLGFLGAIPGSTKLYRFDDTNQEAGSNMTVLLERTGLSLFGKDRDGTLRPDWFSRKICTSIRPRIEGTGPVMVTVGGQEERGGAVTWGTPQSFDPDTGFKLDVTIPGRLMAVRFGSTSDISWKLHGYDLVVEKLGAF